ncbi:hypothetical protein, partial [Streptococcus pneumoniae]|uniref:hypothetical protein n=1 Tax=Streptococcus pneumoniae TaxID=1313 RepID=UPI001CA49EAF
TSFAPLFPNYKSSYLSKINPNFYYLAKICYNLTNNKSSEFITLNEKHPVRQDLGCFFAPATTH